MIDFSTEPGVADEQVRTIIITLITFGWVDGQFDITEKQFIRDYIAQLGEWRAEVDDVPRSDLPAHAQGYTRHFMRIFQGVDRYIADLAQESVAEGETSQQFVINKLKLKCIEAFQGFDEDAQDHLFEVIDELIAADGIIHPEETAFKGELVQFLRTTQLPIRMEEIEAVEPGTFQLQPRTQLPAQMDDHPLLQGLETHFARDPQKRMDQASQDFRLIDAVVQQFGQQRQHGAGRLRGVRSLSELEGQQPFLDEYVHVLPAGLRDRYELIVLGDLHGSYSCLKAALMQSGFFDKVEAYRANPRQHPSVKLVFLGDYIDRGTYSLNGVLRAALQLFATWPEHVYLLRGNHEYYIEKNGQVMSGVLPAEAIMDMMAHLPPHQFQAYKTLFENLPVMLLFGRTVLVHAGIPRDTTLQERWADLSSLNDPAIRFEMMWSDPSKATHVPPNLQGDNARFSFGSLQFCKFMSMIGANTLIRGHEKVLGGFAEVINQEGMRFLTLFSAGGRNNDDLPARSNYRMVTPMALTITCERGVQTATPWLIDYEPYLAPERNGFYRTPPEIQPDR